MSKIDLLDLRDIKHHSKSKTYLPKNLFTCERVWLRIDRVRKPLEAPYMGPFKVVTRLPKHFVLEMSEDIHLMVQNQM